MINLINQLISDDTILSRRYITYGGFTFTTIMYPHNIYDAIVVGKICEEGTKTPKEQIDCINQYDLEKAKIVTDSIEFITQCPNLKKIQIIPSVNAKDGFDYSPLYEMPRLTSVDVRTLYGYKNNFSTSIDYSQISGIERLSIAGCGHKNYNQIKTLKTLGISGYEKLDLTNMFCSSILDTLMIIQSKIKSLEGIQQSKKMQCLYLYHNRSLRDISSLRKVNQTLRALRIENCSNIEDFSALAELEQLELLELSGSNSLVDLSFLKHMKNLKTFIFSMNVLHGDLSPCKHLQYVYCVKNRRHYNLKDAELPKGIYMRGNESIDSWRRFE